MIISMTPLRVSFLGGGTDYPEYFSEHGGVTLGTSIDKYTYITVSPLTEFFDYSIRVSYSRTELVKEVDEINHPSVRECLRLVGIKSGVEITVVSDLPARSGLGSSSCFTVGLLHALHTFKGEMVSREQLAEEAVHVERNMIESRVGLQDQYTCALGGFVHLKFDDEKRVTVDPVVIAKDRLQALQDRLLLFYTGIQRSAHEVLKEQMRRTEAGDINEYLANLKEITAHGLEVLGNSHNLTSFGELLHEGWNLKRRFSDTITTEAIDGAYERALEAGAVGGKLLGAGGGGFMLLYAEPYNQDKVRGALGAFKEVKFSFENKGTRLIFYRP